MQEPSPLPPGQVEVDDFPRFGLLNFAFRFPTETERIEIAVDGDVERPTRFSEELESLEPFIDAVIDALVVARLEVQAVKV